MNYQDERREAAIKRLEDKRDLRNHAFVFVVVNTMLVVIWAATGAGYFWPIWPIAGWSLGLVLNALAVYRHQSISEEAIQAEMLIDER